MNANYDYVKYLLWVSKKKPQNNLRILTKVFGYHVIFFLASMMFQ